MSGNCRCRNPDTNRQFPPAESKTKKTKQKKQLFLGIHLWRNCSDILGSGVKQRATRHTGHRQQGCDMKKKKPQRHLHAKRKFTGRNQIKQKIENEIGACFLGSV